MKKEVKPGEIVFVDLGGSYLKAEIKEVQGENMTVELRDGTQFSEKLESKSVEFQKNKDQRFAHSDLENKLKGAYVSWNKLSEVDRNDLAEGKEVLYRNRYLKDNGEGVKIPKEVVKVLHFTFDSKNNATVLKVHNKNNKELKIEEKEFYHYKFNENEIKDLNEDKTVLFEGSTNDGETFERIAYLDKDLNDIRTKGVLTEKTKFYGKNLTKEQANTINKGGSTEITIDTKNGKKTYEVTFDFKRNTFKTNSLDKEKLNGIETSSANVKADQKKNNSVNKTSGKKGATMSV